MKVKLVSLTKPMVQEVPDMTAEELIVYTARVSNPGNQMNTATAPKLLRYLIDNKHVSPFEQVDMGVEVTTSRAIAAQILRHWSMSFQEFSQRYAKVTEMEPVQLRRQAEKNRQSSEEEFDPIIPGIDGKGYPASLVISELISASQTIYSQLLDAGTAKECARMILPLTTQTTIYMKGNIRDWIFYLAQRCDKHTQLEHRQAALEIKALFIEYFPSIAEAIYT